MRHWIYNTIHVPLSLSGKTGGSSVIGESELELLLSSKGNIKAELAAFSVCQFYISFPVCE